MRIVCGVLGAVLASGWCWGQTAPDEHTLLLCHFDRSIDADYARGLAYGSGTGTITADGRIGSAADLTGSRSLSYSGPGNLDPAAGTISMWIQPRWPGNDGVSHGILNARADTFNYIVVNTLRGGGLGVAMSGGTGEEDRVWRRVNGEIGSWKPGEWHFIAAVWGRGELHFFIDGEEVGKHVADAKMMTQTPPSISLSGEVILDELRVSEAMLNQSEIRAAAQARAGTPEYVYLSDLEAEADPPGRVGTNGRWVNRVIRVPLVIDGMAYARGWSVVAPCSIRCTLPDGFARVVGGAGIDDLSDDGAEATFRIFVGDHQAFDSGPMRRGDGTKRFDIPLAGSTAVRFVTTTPTPGAASVYADWVDVAALTKTVRDLPSFSSELDADRLEVMRRQAEAARFNFDLPPAPSGYLIYPRNYLDDIDPDSPPTETPGARLSTFAAQGQYASVDFAIFAEKELRSVEVEVTDLRSGAGVIPSVRVRTYEVIRCLERRLYTRPAIHSDVVSRFLLPLKPVDVGARNVHEVYVTIKTPENAAPGTYTGTITVRPQNAEPTTLAVSLEVLPFRLEPPREHFYGMYYRFPADATDDAKVRLELEDIRDHGCTTLKPNMGIGYSRDEGGEARISYDTLRRWVRLMRDLGFHGPLPVNTGLQQLASLLGHTGIASSEAARAALEADPAFRTAAKQAMLGLNDLQREFPEFEFLPTHMDEVLGRGRLPLYIALTKAVRQVPDLRVYITMHNRPDPAVEELTAQIDPYADVRCYNGHVMDWWIQAGHSFDELAQQLKASGDEAWTYYNMRGSFFLPIWTRLVNSLYLYASPLKCHVPWMYHSYKGNPFDDTDGPAVKGHDFGYAFPSPDDGMTPIPTRSWEAFRDGVYDMAYFEMLERLIATVKPKNPAATQAAEDWLAHVKGLVPSSEQIADIEEESPILVYWTRGMRGDDLQEIRYKTARFIIELQKAGVTSR